MDLVYRNYWERKKLLASRTSGFPLRRWWSTDGLCDIERVYFEGVRNCASLLDVGAGDLRVRDKLVRAGFKGEYHTQDVGGEYRHDYQSLDDVKRTYGAIICFDVLEHLPLHAGMTMLTRMVELLEPGGVLVLQTPNARCIRSPYAWDMTHLHTYNLPDLWAYLTVLGFRVDGYRVVFEAERPSLGAKFKSMLGRLVVTRFLGGDYADNIALVAVKGKSP